MAKGKIQVKLPSEYIIQRANLALAKYKNNTVLVVKLMFMGMVNRHVKVPLKVSKFIQIEIEWNLVHSFFKQTLVSLRSLADFH